MTMNPVSSVPPTLTPETPPPLPVSSAARENEAPRHVPCPRCQRPLELGADGQTSCQCGWHGRAWAFSPVAVVVQKAEQALPEDATCFNHSTKKATAICAGTGDYICALCAIELEGKIYSAAYLNRAGKDKAGKAFDRYLDRPDSTIRACIVGCFIPYVNMFLFGFFFLWAPYCVVLYFRALRLRKTDPVFARLMGPVSVVVLPLLLGLISLGWLAMVFVIVLAVIRQSAGV